MELGSKLLPQKINKKTHKFKKAVEQVCIKAHPSNRIYSSFIHAFTAPFCCVEQCFWGKAQTHIKESELNNGSPHVQVTFKRMTALLKKKMAFIVYPGTPRNLANIDACLLFFFVFLELSSQESKGNEE